MTAAITQRPPQREPKRQPCWTEAARPKTVNTTIASWGCIFHNGRFEQNQLGRQKDEVGFVCGCDFHTGNSKSRKKLKFGTTTGHQTFAVQPLVHRAQKVTLIHMCKETLTHTKIIHTGSQQDSCSRWLKFVFTPGGPHSYYNTTLHQETLIYTSWETLVHISPMIHTKFTLVHSIQHQGADSHQQINVLLEQAE